MSGTSSHCARKSWSVGRSGFQTGLGVWARGWMRQPNRPAVAEPWVPSTWNSTSSPRSTRTAQEELIWAMIPPLELEDAVRRVVGGGHVGVALLVPALRDVGDGLGHHGLDGAEQVLQHVVPVAEHVEHHAAAVLGAVVPARALGGDDVTLEHPVAELAADRQDAAEEAEVDQPLQLDQAGEVELVVHDTGDGAGLLRGGHQLLAVQHGLGDRLLGEDVLAGLDGGQDGAGALGGDLGVEVDRRLGVGQGGVEIGGPLG